MWWASMEIRYKRRFVDQPARGVGISQNKKNRQQQCNVLRLRGRGRRVFKPSGALISLVSCLVRSWALRPARVRLHVVPAVTFGELPHMVDRETRRNCLAPSPRGAGKRAVVKFRRGVMPRARHPAAGLLCLAGLQPHPRPNAGSCRQGAGLLFLFLPRKSQSNLARPRECPAAIGAAGGIST